MNILFGGSFNPITKAHLSIIDLLKEKFNPDNIIVMPVGDSYTWKSLANFNDRINMINLVKRDFIVSDFEGKNKKYLGTIHTLDELAKTYDDLYFCMGADNILKLDQWIDYEKLLEKYNFIVFTRKGFDIESIIDLKYKKYKTHFHKLELDFDISSSNL